MTDQRDDGNQRSSFSSTTSASFPREPHGEPRSRTRRAPVPPAWCDRRDYLAARRGGGGREAEEESRESATTELNRPANGSVYGVCCFELSAGFAPASDIGTRDDDDSPMF